MASHLKPGVFQSSLTLLVQRSACFLEKCKFSAHKNKGLSIDRPLFLWADGKVRVKGIKEEGERANMRCEGMEAAAESLFKSLEQVPDPRKSRGV